MSEKTIPGMQPREAVNDGKVSVSDAKIARVKQNSQSSWDERLEQEQQARVNLRDMVAHLRDVGGEMALPASASFPSFKIGEVRQFQGTLEPHHSEPGRGHLDRDTYDDVLKQLRMASQKSDPPARDAATGRAAKLVAKDWAAKNGHGSQPDSLLGSVLRESRAQAVFAARELGQQLGLGPTASSALGYSFERALEKEGFKVMASQVIDRAADVFKPSTTSVATTSGFRHTMEQRLDDSMKFLARHGVTAENFKGLVQKHTGKFQAVATLASNPEVVTRAAQVLAHSDKALDGVMALATDKEFRQAAGTLVMAAGESAAFVNKGVGSAAIVAGAALRGESAENMGRHVFRAGMAVLGGAAGGLAGGAVSAGFGSVFGAVAGAEAGSALADKLISLYDRYMGNESQQTQERQVSREEAKEAGKLASERLGVHAKAGLEGQAPDAVSHISARVSAMEREYAHKPGGV